MTHNENIPIKLLWTGGWDSTFRLLQCAIVLKARVQPYYLIDTSRNSVLQELRAINTIKKELFKSFPHAKELIYPTIFFDISNVPENDTITSSYKDIITSIKFGEQYEWLARFCHFKNISDMELCFEKDLTSEKYRTIRANLKETKTIHGITFVTEENTKSSFSTLFSCFEWPIIEISRKNMIEISEKYSFRHLLNHTWFCHNPLKDNTPCGICTPCIQVMESSLSNRLPDRAKIRYHLRGIISRHHFKNKHKKMYNFMLEVSKKRK